MGVREHVGAATASRAMHTMPLQTALGQGQGDTWGSSGFWGSLGSPSLHSECSRHLLQTPSTPLTAHTLKLGTPFLCDPR